MERLETLVKLGGPTEEEAVKASTFFLQSGLEGQGKVCPDQRAKDTIYTWPDLGREVPNFQPLTVYFSYE